MPILNYCIAGYFIRCKSCSQDLYWMNGGFIKEGNTWITVLSSEISSKT